MALLQSDIDTLGVIGAGQMGRGIAAVQAKSGYSVRLFDIDEEQLGEAKEHINWSFDKLVEKGEINRDEADRFVDNITITSEMEEAVSGCQFITEATPEEMSIKREVFNNLDKYAAKDAILATNTSGLHITELAELVSKPSRVLGTHWFNPPMLMELVEVILTPHTDETTVANATELIKSWDRTPITCEKDIPNFVVNRLIRPFGETAAWLVHYTEADVIPVDAAFKHREEFPMGPFELLDFTGGIKIRVEGESDHLEDPRPLSYDTKVCPLIHELYNKGYHGRSAGRGFYQYGEEDGPTIDAEHAYGFDPDRVWAQVINEGYKLAQHDVATAEDIDLGMKLGGNWPIGPMEKASEIGLDRVFEHCIALTGRHVAHGEFRKATETVPCKALRDAVIDGETI